MRRIIAPLLMIAASLSLVTSAALPCSVCHCGDNSFQFADQSLPLADRTVAGRFRLTLANSYSSKSNALEDGSGRERQRENRPSVRALYKPGSEFVFSAELPFTTKRLTETVDDVSEHTDASGLGDAELGIQWTHDLSKSCPSMYAVGVSALCKLPTGKNSISRDGERLEAHLQPGTGTADVTFGVGASRTGRRLRLFFSAYYRLNGTNGHQFHYGDALLLNIGGQYALSRTLFASVQLNGRDARRDIDDSTVDENSGGSIVYVTPGLRLAVLRPVVLVSSLQIPVWAKLNGVQKENPVLLTGLTLDF